MTLMLASVVDAAEAELALTGGADIIDFADPRTGALGAVPVETISAAVARLGKDRAISAALGPPPYDAEALARASVLSAAGVVCLRLAAEAESLDRLAPAFRALALELDLIAVMFADEEPDFGALDRLAAAGVKGALLDAAGKRDKRLLDHLPPHRIEAFCRECRRLGVGSWLAGSLQSPDIPRLLLIEPDVLGFRSALCARGRRDGPLDAQRIALIRDLIPQGPALPHAGEGRGEGSAGEGGGEGPGETFDTVFVHDFQASAEIGAYAHERGGKQRLLFNIDASISRVAAHSDDMRAIFSYDVILDAVRLVVGRGHIDFIETVAEAVATLVLKHPRVHEVRVRVEKLDVVPGSVGVEIRRFAAAGQRQSGTMAASSRP